MTDQNANAVGCLGRMLTFFGMVWIAIIVLGGIGVLSRLGMSGDFLAGFGGSIIPALFLLGAGRALRRRATTMSEQPESMPMPDVQSSEGRRVPSIRPEPSAPSPIPRPIPVPPPAATLPKTVQPRPRPVDPIAKARRDVAERLEEAVSGLEEPTRVPSPASIDEKSSRPKTSQELVDEARKRWGVDKTR